MNTPDRTVSLLRDLVAIDSVNPSLVAGGAGEESIADRVATDMRSFGADVSVETVTPGRPNVIGVIDGREPGPSLMLCGHLDTVGVEGMKAPFDPAVRDGRLYGRGSQDMKGGLAAILDAARQVAEKGGLEKGRLVVAAVADEEYGSIGAEALVKNWRADACIICEPTDLVVAIGHKGFAWVEVRTKGVAAHGSRPSDGRDAIFRMGRVLVRLEALDRELQSRPRHPHLGTGSLHASLVGGGREMSTYPDDCWLQIERRLLTGEPVETALPEAEAVLASLRSQDPELQAEARYMFGRPAYETPAACPLPALIETALAKRGRPAQRSGVSFWTDAGVLGPAGTPSVVFGPGGAGLHSVEEYVLLDEVLACRDVLVDVTRAFCELGHGQ